MVEEDIGNGKGVLQFPVADEGHGAHYADPLLPNRLPVPCQIIQEAAVFLREKPFAQKGIAAQVHEVPVVDAVCM